MPLFRRLISDAAQPAHRPLRRLAAQDGVTIVEVAITGLMVGLISLSLIGLDAAGKTASDQRRRAQAFGVAQGDQERIKGLSADQIATLNQTRTVTLDGVAYTVTSTGQFISSSASSASCSSSAAAADYAKVVSTVDWAANRRADIVVQSVVTPRAGGSLLAQVLDQNANPVPGARVNVAGSDPNTDAVRRFGVTDSGGCTIFGTLLEGDYTVSPVLAGYVDFDGDATPSSQATTAAGTTTQASFRLGRAGKIVASFSTSIAGTTYTGQLAPALAWFNTAMATPGFLTASSPQATITTSQTLFPFNTTTPYGQYTVWAGSCDKSTPALAANQSYANMTPAATVTLSGSSGSVKLPALIVKVLYKSSAGASAVRKKPAHVELTDPCGANYQPPLNPSALDTPVPDTGALQFPGQPYADPTGAKPGSYTVCADYNGYKATATGVSNKDFINGTTVTLTIQNLVNPGLC